MIKYLSILEREIVFSLKFNNELFMATMLFFLSLSMFSISLGGDVAILSRVSLNALWILFLFSSMLTLQRIYSAESSTDLMLFYLPRFCSTKKDMSAFLRFRIICYWLGNTLPLLLLIPIACIFLSIKISALVVLFPTMVISSLSLTFLFSLGNALTVGIKQSSVLLPLLIFPLYIPILIFSISSVQNYMERVIFWPQISFLILFLAFVVLFVPKVTEMLLVHQAE